MIPPTFHRVWLDEPVPERFDEYWSRLRALHPGWDFRTWQDSAEVREHLQHRALFDSFTEYPAAYALRSDLARYELVEKFGGVYVDTDVEPLRAFDALLADGRAFIGWEDDKMLCPTVFGAEAGAPPLKDLLRALPEWQAVNAAKEPNHRTGPVLVTHEWRNRDDVRRLPVSTFYPVGWWEKDLLGEVTYPPETLAVHHWFKGWGK